MALLVIFSSPFDAAEDERKSIMHSLSFSAITSQFIEFYLPPPIAARETRMREKIIGKIHFTMKSTANHRISPPESYNYLMDSPYTLLSSV